MKLGPDAWCLFAEGKVDQLELGWYLYIYMYMIYVCMFITDCRQAWLIIFTVDLLLLCECNWFAMFFMLRRLFAMNSCTAVESLDWSLEVHDATYAKLLSIGPNLFFRPVQKKKHHHGVYGSHWKNTIDLINSIQILQPFISFLGKNQAFGAFTMWGVLVIVDNICLHLYINIFIYIHNILYIYLL